VELVNVVEITSTDPGDVIMKPRSSKEQKGQPNRQNGGNGQNGGKAPTKNPRAARGSQRKASNQNTANSLHPVEAHATGIVGIALSQPASAARNVENTPENRPVVVSLANASANASPNPNLAVDAINNLLHSGFPPKPKKRQPEETQNRKLKTVFPKVKAYRVPGPDEAFESWGDFKGNGDWDYDPNVLRSLQFPPESWEERDGYLDTDKDYTVLCWLATTEDAVEFSVNTRLLIEHSDKSVAWRDWYKFPNGFSARAKIEDRNLDDFFEVNLRMHPLPDRDIRPIGWWKTYVSPRSTLILAPDHPSAKLDPMDERYLEAKIAPTAEERMNERIRVLSFVKDIPRVVPVPKVVERASFAPNPPIAAVWQGAVEQVQPQPVLNIYLRPAYEGDVAQITKIYNHYVENTWFTPERGTLTTRNMSQRINDIDNVNLPWIVAVQRSASTARRDLEEGVFAGREKILGYAFADDHNGMSGALRFTGEIEVYVQRDARNQGVGKCLLDRLLYMLESDYQPAMDYPWYCNGRFAISGSVRRFHRILATILIAPEDKGDFGRSQWMQHYLQSFGFEKCGHLSEVGLRKGRR
jgi:L-amino acid N-acyltransferase YncA